MLFQIRSAICAVLLVFLFSSSARAAEIRFYNPDPNHPLNRVHDALFVRVGPDGKEYGIDRLDPLIWGKSQFLLDGPSLDRAVATLTDAAKLDRGEYLRLSLRQRAILQRDLWAVFDSVVDRGERQHHWRLLELLSTLIQRLALNDRELEQLKTDARSGNRDMLQALSSNGYVELASQNKYPIGATHAAFFGGRSTFLVFMRTKGGEQGVETYLKRLFLFPNPLTASNEPHPPLNPRLPLPEVGTEFVFLRFLNLINADGEMVSSPVVEMFSMMKATETEEGLFFNRFGRSVLSRERFFIGQGNGLRGVPRTETDFFQFLAPPLDPFEDSRAWRQEGVIDSCLRCHTQMGGLKFPGVHGVQSYARDFSFKIKTDRVDPMFPAAGVSQFELTKNWKQQQADFQFLLKTNRPRRY